MIAGSDDDAPFRLSSEQAAQLSELLQRGGTRTVQLDTPKGRFAVTLRDAAALPESVVESGSTRGELVRSASVGEFLTSHPARPGAVLRHGARLAPGDLLGLVRTGLVFAPIVLPATDPRPATLTRVLVPAGTLVGYGTPLFEVERH